MGLVDSHCHIQDKAFDDDRTEVLDRALAALDWLVVVGDDMPRSRGALELVQDRVYATVGIHPYHAGEAVNGALPELKTLAQCKGVVALGEIGLDYFKYNETPKDVQHEGFRRQLALAAELNLPVVIHNREAQEDIGDILEEYAPDLPGGAMHCFAGDPAFVARCLSWGFYISFAGNVTFPKAEELRVAAKEVPLDRLLVETDSPYLAPQPVRGKRCEPAFVQYTAERVAEVKEVDIDTLTKATSQNAARLFRLPA